MKSIGGFVRKERNVQIVEYELDAGWVKHALLSTLKERASFTQAENIVVVINPDGSAIVSTTFDIK